MSKGGSIATPLDHAHLRVDLAALKANYLHYKRLSDSSETAAVVKADAYGIGLSQAATTLHDAGCRTFFVAQASEGARLRDILTAHNRDAVIYVMNGFLSGSQAFFQNHKLRPCLGSLDEVNNWIAEGGGAASLHVDTGFNRLGLPQADIHNLPAAFSPALVMSHLACADEPDHPMNTQQLKAFETAKAHFQGIPASLANSAGALMGANYHHDMLRVGIGLYGGSPNIDVTKSGKVVVSLYAPVLQTRTVQAGETIGYGATFTAETQMRIAVLSIGYADGFPRLMGRGDKDPLSAHVAFGQQVCPLVGRVSMDLLAVDISDLESDIQRGDLAEIFGHTISLDTVSQQAGTISYEILTQLGSRYKRVYDGI